MTDLRPLATIEIASTLVLELYAVEQDRGVACPWIDVVVNGRGERGHPIAYAAWWLNRRDAAPLEWPLGRPGKAIVRAVELAMKGWDGR